MGAVATWQRTVAFAFLLWLPPLGMADENGYAPVRMPNAGGLPAGAFLRVTDGGDASPDAGETPLFGDPFNRAPVLASSGWRATVRSSDPLPFSAVVRLGDGVDPQSRVVPAQAAVPSQPLDTAAVPRQPLDYDTRIRLANRVTTQTSDIDQLVNDLDRIFGPSAAPATSSAGASTRLDEGTSQRAAQALEQTLTQPLTSTPSVDVVTGGELELLGITESAQVLERSPSIRTVEVRRRSPIDFDPRIRGYQTGQVYTSSDGAQWLPARQDLDTILSKLDPSLIQDVIVIPGPYGLRYGPGFSFLDILTSPTPRYECGAEMHNRMGMTLRTNGGQIYGRDTIYGGSSDWGLILNYGYRTGSDYESGGGQLIPGSYGAHNILGQIGIDTGPEANLEFRYQRLDQSDTEYAGLFFDLDRLTTDGFALNWINEDATAYWRRWQLDAWYNRTSFFGDTLNRSKQTFNVINRVEAALGYPLVGETDGGLTTAGIRSSMLFGEDDQQQLRVGLDFHYHDQQIEERYAIFDARPPTEFATNLPQSAIYDPGLFAEWTLPWHPYWTTTLGARVDWVNTTADQQDLRDETSLPGDGLNLDQNDVLYAFYLINEVQLTDTWKTRFGFGHSQRVPTLIERYADGVFLGILQSGFSRIIGDPALDKERAWQVDASLAADYGDWSLRLGGFHAWITDYVTYTGNIITDPSGARLLRTLNTDLATLTGGELYSEGQLTHRLTAFGSVQYVDGLDREINRPLSGISPLEGRAGLRLLDRNRGERWAIEFSSRIVDNQDRLGALRIGTTSVVDIVPLELPTPGFTTFNLRGYWNISESILFVAGVDNLFDRDYLEHLNLRLPDQGPFTGTRVMEPGFSPYASIEWTF